MSDAEGAYNYEGVKLTKGGFGGYEVDPEALRDYATRLKAFGDRFTALAQAADSTTSVDGAFGLLTFWMGPLLDEKHAMVAELIPANIESLEAYIEALNGCAAEYEAADTDAASDLTRLEDQF
ncbi:type VII secretion target [Glycomyces buryatensis]|uniref:PE domain-containing protein n=1 Tax=Glycomyces buryatensis TaxID=2570927 RepID=A0A4S8QGG2_9ACTN|nr:type VII secretion target [Glycomyces buryatensis]THV42262.1 hypothetical protein FAB82_07225 [Glycomyces buryatensis]